MSDPKPNRCESQFLPNYPKLGDLKIGELFIFHGNTVHEACMIIAEQNGPRENEHWVLDLSWGRITYIIGGRDRQVERIGRVIIDRL